MLKDSQITNYLNLIKRLNKEKKNQQQEKSSQFKHKSFGKGNYPLSLKQKRRKFLKAAISDVELKIRVSDKSKRSNIYSKYFEGIEKKKQKNFKTQIDIQCFDLFPKVTRYPTEEFDGTYNTYISKTQNYNKKNRNALTQIVKKEQNSQSSNQNLFFKKNTVSWRAHYKNSEERSLQRKMKQTKNDRGLGVIGIEALCSEDFSKSSSKGRIKTLSSICKKLSSQRKHHRKINLSKIIEKRNEESHVQNFFSNAKIEGWKNEELIEPQYFA